jgi:thioredoxin 1
MAGLLAEERSPPPPPAVLSVTCLCAAWCHLCDSYRPVLQAVVGEFVARGGARPARWVDIEDEAALVGDVDVETFPTLIVQDAQRVLFAGPLMPQPQTLRRLLASLAEWPQAQRDVAPAVLALAARLRAEADQASGAMPSA